MSIFQRLKYAMFVLIAVTMIVTLTLSIGEGLGVIRDSSVQALMFHPMYFLSVLVVGFALAPALSERIPTSGDPPRTPANREQRVGFPVRALLLGLLAIVLAIVVNLVVFLVERFA